MPRKFEGYTPDAIDCNTQVTALGLDFGVLVKTSVEFARDEAVVLCACFRIGSESDGTPVVQSRARKPLKSKPDIAVMIFSALQDCWHQLDRGVLGAKPPAIAHDWNGRPHIARRNT